MQRGQKADEVACFNQIIIAPPINYFVVASVTIIFMGKQTWSPKTGRGILDHMCYAVCGG